MATYFGEVRDLSSRAVDDMEDDGSSEYSTVTVNLKHPSYDDSVKKFEGDEILVIAVGDMALIFCQCYLRGDGYQEVGSINAPCCEDCEPTTLGWVFRSKHQPHVTICEMRDGVEECFFTAAEALCGTRFSGSVNPQSRLRCIILTSLHITAYKQGLGSTAQEEEPFLKTLATCSYINRYPSLSVDYLYPPNIISGLSAALMTSCEVRKREAILYVCYTGKSDSCAAKTFETVLRDPLLSGVQVRQDSAQKLKKIFNFRNQMASNLFV